MKLLLAIETTGAHLGLSIYKFDPKKSIRMATYYSLQPHRQSEMLFPVLDKLLRRNRLKREDINFIVVDIGPGSFTGVRVGVSAARGMGQALGASVIGVSSLEAMAHAALKRNFRKPEKILARIAALQNEVYAAVYERGQNGVLREVSAPRWMPEKELPRLTSVVDPPHPESLAELAIQKISSKPKLARFDYNAVEPLYLQPSWAERKQRPC